MRPLPIRVQLTLWYFVFFAGAGFLLSGGSWILLRQSLNTITAHELEERVDDIQRFLEVQGPDASLTQLQSELAKDYMLKDEGKWLQILDEQGNWLYYSQRTSIAQPLPALPPAPGTVIDFAPGPRRALHSLTRQFKTHGHTYFVATAIAVSKSQAILAGFQRDLFLLTPAVLLMAAFAGHCLSRKALAPVAAIAVEARRINDRNLQTRLPRLTSRDELSHLSDTLNQMLERIDLAFRSVRSLTANASHELRTPLSLIRTRVEIALCFPRSAEHYRHTLEEVQRETVHMTSLIDSLLALARADAGAQQLQMETVELNTLVESVALEWSATAETLGLTLLVRTTGQPVEVLGDRPSLCRLLRILMENACHHTMQHGTICIGAEAERYSASFFVRDSGVGIEEQHLTRIFDRFYRVARAGVGEGSGLGLALAKWIADQHHATISVESAVGIGSCFRVTLQEHRAASQLPDALAQSRS